MKLLNAGIGAIAVAATLAPFGAMAAERTLTLVTSLQRSNTW